MYWKCFIFLQLDSEIILICWFDAQETFLSMLKTVVLRKILVETVINCLTGLFDEKKVQKNSIYLQHN